MRKEKAAPDKTDRAAIGEKPDVVGQPQAAGHREADAKTASEADPILFDAGEKRPRRMASKRRLPAPGTGGYPEQQPTPNDDRDMPDEKTPHEPQNKPEEAHDEAPRRQKR